MYKVSGRRCTTRDWREKREVHGPLTWALSALLPPPPALRHSQIPDGKPENTFAFSGEAKNLKYANEVIHECHEAWQRLIRGEADKGKIDVCVPLSLLHSLMSPHADPPGAIRDRSTNSTLQGTPGFSASTDSVPADSRQPAAPIDASIDKTFFISGHVRRAFSPFVTDRVAPHARLWTDGERSQAV